jgi:probable phosphoglycerate mutase
MNGTRVHLVRHGSHDALGRTLSGRGPASLDARGRAEAAALADWLAGEGIATIRTSPVRRAVETAEILARRLQVRVESDAALQEIDFGTWEGAAFESLDPRPDWQRWNADRARSTTPGGETMLDVQLRVARWLAGIGEGGTGSLVAVSHSDVIKALVAHVVGLPIHFHDRLEVAPGSLSTILVGGWGMRLLSLNETPHG